MKILSLLILTLFLSPLIAAAQQISGRVIDQASGKPVGSVSIFTGESVNGTTTAEDGTFTLNVGESGKIRLTASHIAYQSTTLVLDVPSAGLTGVEIRLQPAVSEIPQTIITATRTRRDIRDVPAAVRLYTTEQIEVSPMTSLDDILCSDASINVDRKNGIFSKNASVTMRGLNSSARTLILLDGIPLNKADGGGVNWNRINPENTDRIEIIKGPSSALYGGNAMGGVINVISKEIPAKTSGSVKLSAGSCNTQSAQLWLGGHSKTLPALGWSLNSFYRRGDGYMIAPVEGRDSTDIKAYRWEYNLGGKLTYALSDSSRIEAGYSYSDDKQGDGIRVYDPDGGYYKYRTHQGWLNYRASLGRTRIVFSAYLQRENYQNQKEQLKTEKVPPYAVTQYALYLTDSKRNDAGIWATATRSLGSHKFTAGADVRLSGADASDIYFTSTDTLSNRGKMNALALFLQDEYTPAGSRLRFIAGARADAISFRDGSFRIAAPSVTNSYMAQYAAEYADKNWLALSPKLGILYQMNPATRLYLNYSSGFRPGTLDDMCRSGSISKGFKMANPELEPEKISNFEAGASIGSGKAVQFEPSVYYSLGNKFQYFVGTGDTVYNTSGAKAILKRENVSKVTVAGAEATLRIRPVDGLLFTVSYAYNHSVIKDFDTVKFVAKDLSGKFLMEVPENRFTASANWKNPYFNAMVFCEYTGPMYTDDENLLQQPSYYRLDAKISRVFAERYYLAFTVQNLTNTRYTDNKGNLGISRFFIAEAGYRF
jgi:iron complex outermembrane recepter protein